MANHHQRTLELAQRFDKRLDGAHIQMVRDLIPDEHMWIMKRDQRKGNSIPLPTTQRAYRTRHRGARQDTTQSATSHRPRR